MKEASRVENTSKARSSFIIKPWRNFSTMAKNKDGICQNASDLPTITVRVGVHNA